MDKPEGMTSAQAVALVKRLLPRSVRVGHAGTLDRFATGLLVLLVGAATRRCEQVMGWTKIYQARIRLGATTPTLDPDSDPEIDPGAVEIPRTRVVEAVKRWIGDVRQVPPAFSALKVGGRRVSDRTRAGEALELQPRLVRVHSIEILRYDYPELQIEVTCGRGTYVRALARDLAREMGTQGYLLALRRTRIGDISVDEAVRPEKLTPAEVQLRLRRANGAL